MEHKIKKNGGFTLLEVVISIAALSIISVFILKMFVASSNLNDRARDTDIAVNLSITEIEKLKSHESLPDYIKTDGPEDVRETADTVTASFYYDDSWELMEYAKSPADNAKYQLTLQISPDAASSFENAQGGALYTVAAQVLDLSSEANNAELASLQTKKYFPNGLSEAEEGGV